MEERLRILLCEDDENLGMLLREYLQAKGFSADLFADGESGYKAFLKGKYDICVLDVMMPKKDGFALAQEIRTVNSEVPIIFLTAKSLKEDILEGFKIGADDYLTKPFSMEELVFRIEAILRRVKGKKGKEVTMYKIGRFTFDTQKQVLMIGDKITKLTTKESELLSLLCAHVNEILERNFALKTIWIDDNYFNALYQGIPNGGYTAMVEKMLVGTEVRLNVDYLADKAALDALAEKVVYTGPVDAYFGYRLGALQYRSVRFETEVLDTDNYQGNAVVNYTDAETPYTRIIEHKHFEFGTQPKTVISREYSAEWKKGDEPYYPVNDEKNGALYAQYKALADAEPGVIFGGRLGEYKYYDMDKVIEVALDVAAKELA